MRPSVLSSSETRPSLSPWLLWQERPARCRRDRLLLLHQCCSPKPELHRLTDAFRNTGSAILSIRARARQWPCSLPTRAAAGSCPEDNKNSRRAPVERQAFREGKRGNPLCKRCLAQPCWTWSGSACTPIRPQQEEITTKGMEKLLRESILLAPNDRAYRSKNRKARSLRFWTPMTLPCCKGRRPRRLCCQTLIIASDSCSCSFKLM